MTLCSVIQHYLAIIGADNTVFRKRTVINVTYLYLLLMVLVIDYTIFNLNRLTYIIAHLLLIAASFFFGARIWLGTILCRFSINYFSGLGLKIRVWVRGHSSVT